MPFRFETCHTRNIPFRFFFHPASFCRLYITTSNFTKEALTYTPRNETKIVLIDGEQLTQLMIDYNLGCTTQQTYELKKLDSDYFGEE
ncbi:restriction endonuclease [Porphyromonas gingivalis]|uniref:restriction endonuclease n=1 Tax=Porphyromonas gingivalis TaxID=837 RepID=UPI0030C86493